MTAEWRESEALELQKAIERGDRSASSMEFQEDVLHEPLDDLSLPDEMSVETVWAEKEEIAPLGSAAQAMIADVVRRSLSQSNDKKRNEIVYDTSFLTSKARLHLHRIGSAPPRTPDSWPFSKRRRAGEDYIKISRLQGRRSSYDDLHVKEQSNLALSSSSSSKGEEDEEKAGIDSSSSFLSSVFMKEKIEENHSLLTSSDISRRYGEAWPLRATSYFHPPEKILTPLNIFYERNRIHKERKKKASLSFTVSLANVPKVVLLENLADSIDACKDEREGFLIDLVDESLLAAVDQGEEKKEGEEEASEEKKRQDESTIARLLFRSSSLPPIFIGGGAGGGRGEERTKELFDSHQIFQALLLQGSIQLDGVGTIARRTAESLK
ncbi:hypothetical protein CSUI_011298, partial [Cystoisospora suis]